MDNVIDLGSYKNKNIESGRKSNQDKLCNWCGMSMCLWSDEEVENIGVSPYPMGLVNQTLYGHSLSHPGIGRGTLDDDSSYTFSLCEFCLDHMFQQFKVPPMTSRYVHGMMDIGFVAAEQRVQNKIKRDAATGGNYHRLTKYIASWFKSKQERDQARNK